MKKKSCRERIKCNPNSNDDITGIEQFLSVIKQKIREGTFDYSEAFPNSKNRLQFLDPTIVGNYLKCWLAENKSRLKASTYNEYRKVIENQFQGIMPKLMVELTYRDIKKEALKLSISQKTLNNYLSTLRQAFEEAEQDELIPGYRNPLSGRKIKLRSVRVVKDEIDPFSREEIAKIIDAAEGIERLMIAFDFHTGLRPSELIALEYDSIDWNGFVQITQVQTEASKKFEEPKTTASIRSVKLSATALSFLKMAKQFTCLQNKTIFINPRTGEPYTGDQAVRKAFKRICQKAGVRYRYPYQMRHTYASSSLMAGEDLGLYIKTARP